MSIDKKREAECFFLTLDENSDQAMNYLENNQMQWRQKNKAKNINRTALYLCF